MQGGHNATPVQQIAQAPENAVLWDEGAGGPTPEQGVDGSVIVEVQVDGKVMAKGCQGDGFESSEELGCLLSQNPWGAGEKTSAHVPFPNANKESSTRCPCCISEVAICRGRGASGQRGSAAPSRERYGKGFQGRPGEGRRCESSIEGTMTQGSKRAGKEGQDAPAGLGKPN